MNIRYAVIGVTRDRRSDYLRACGEALAHQQRLRLAKLAPLGPLEPEIIPATEAPRDLFEDDKGSVLRDDWRAEARELARMDVYDELGMDLR